MSEGAPTKSVVASNVDFGVSDSETQEVQQEVEALGKAVTRSVEQAWLTGKALARAKKKVRHGYWLAYVEGVVGLEHRTAQRLIEVYRRDPKKRHVSHLTSISEALRTLPVPRKKGRENAGDKGDDASQAGDGPAEGGKGAGNRSAARSGGDESGEAGEKDGNWSTALAQVQPVLREIGADGCRLPKKELAALVEMAVAAATAVRQQLALASESDQYVALTDDAVGRLRSALAGVAERQDDGA